MSSTDDILPFTPEDSVPMDPDDPTTWPRLTSLEERTKHQGIWARALRLDPGIQAGPHGQLLFTFPGTGVNGPHTLLFDRPEWVRGELITFCSVTTEALGWALGPVRVSLTGAHGREQLEKPLGDLEPDGRDDNRWWMFVDQAFRAVYWHTIEGEPVQVLDLPDPPTEMSTSLLVEPLIPRGQTTIIFGDGGTGKSMICLGGLCLALATGFEVTPGLIPADHGVRSLYLDYESTYEEHRQRLWQLAAARDIPSGNELIHYQRGILPIPECASALADRIATDKIQLLIVDSAALAAGVDPEKTETAIRFFRAVRDLNTTVVVIAHVAKNGDQEKPFGSAFWHNEPSATHLLRVEQEAGEEIVLGLYNKKTRGGALLGPLGWRLRFSPGGIRYNPTSLGESAEHAGRLPVRVRIHNLLSDGEKRAPSQITVELQLPAEQVRARLKDGTVSGEFGRDQAGFYFLQQRASA